MFATAKIIIKCYTQMHCVILQIEIKYVQKINTFTRIFNRKIVNKITRYIEN